MSFGKFIALRSCYIHSVFISKDVLLQIAAPYAVVDQCHNQSSLEIIKPLFLSLIILHSLSFSILTARQKIHTYISWACTSNKKLIVTNFKNHTELLVNSDPKTKCPSSTLWNSSKWMTKENRFSATKRLLPSKEQINVKFLINFLRDLLYCIVW